MKNPFKSKTEPQPENVVQNPVNVVLNDTARVKAALELSYAIRKLADVIAGQTFSAYVTNCKFENIAVGPALKIGSTLDEEI